jgi:hypothetical protein
MLVQAWRSLSYPQIWSSWAKFVQIPAVISAILLFQILYDFLKSAKTRVQGQIEWFKVPRIGIEKI